MDQWDFSQAQYNNQHSGTNVNPPMTLHPENTHQAQHSGISLGNPIKDQFLLQYHPQQQLHALQSQPGSSATTATTATTNSNRDVSSSATTAMPSQPHLYSANSGNTNMLPARAAYYETHYPLYSFDWSSTSAADDVLSQAVVLSTYREDLVNKLQVVVPLVDSNEESTGQGGASDNFGFRCAGQTDVMYPATRVLWDSKMASHGVPRFASSSQYLQLWELGDDDESDGYNTFIGTAMGSRGNRGNQSSSGGGQRIQEKLKLINSKLDHNALPPLTSFDWNSVDNNYVLTSSIDTTCTLWDLTKQAVKTQLIAHDSEVYDVKFIHNNLDTFFSVGADGSVRLFDLRSLEHSTIIYEPPQVVVGDAGVGATAAAGQTSGSNQFPLLRLDTCKTNQNMIAASGLDLSAVMVLDMRYPGSPTFVLDGHAASVNSVRWHPAKQVLLTAGDDCQALLWDLGEASRLRGSQSEQGTPETSLPGKTVRGGSVAWNSRTSHCLRGNVVSCPDYSYSDPLEINWAGWNRSGDWFGVVSGKGFQGVRTY